MFRIDTSGLKKAQQELQKLADNAQRISETKSLTLEEMFTNEFMLKYTKVPTLEKFWEQAPFKFESQEEFDAIPQEMMDNFVKENTQFATWQDMINMGGKLCIEKKLMS